MRRSRKATTRLVWGLATIPAALFFLGQLNEVLFVWFIVSFMAWVAVGNILMLTAPKDD